MAKARLRRGIEMVKLANRISALKLQEEDPENSDMPDDSVAAAASQTKPGQSGSASSSGGGGGLFAAGEKKTLSKAVKGAIFREVVLAKVKEMKQQEQTLKVKEEAEKEARRKSFTES